MDFNDVIKAVERVAPNALDNYHDAIRQGETLFKNADITTHLRMTHFLAQALHEAGGFRILRENMNYSAKRMLEIFGVGNHSAAVTASEAATLAHHPDDIAERVYDLGNPRKARELGNTKPGDGFLYRGNGILQTTGRGNHKRMGAAAGVNFEGDPDLVTDPAHALKPALTEWTQNNLNAFADKNDIRTITRKINGGFNGLPQRKAWFDKVWVLPKGCRRSCGGLGDRWRGRGREAAPGSAQRSWRRPQARGGWPRWAKNRAGCEGVPSRCGY